LALRWWLGHNMLFKPVGRRRGALTAVLRLAAGLVLLFIYGATAHADGWPASVKATYQITFNGFNIGTLDFQSEAESESYTLVANTKLSVLLGAFTWDSETRSFGMLTGKTRIGWERAVTIHAVASGTDPARDSLRFGGISLRSGRPVRLGSINGGG